MSRNVDLLLVLALMVVLCISSAPVLSAAVTENSWISKTSMPTGAPLPDAAVANGKIYVIGNNTNYEYNPVTDTWSTKKPMPTPRTSFAVSACQNKIFVLGGLTGDPNVKLSVNEVYDPVEDVWESKAAMPTNRSQMEANTVNGKIYVTGGRTAGPYSTVNVTEIYDPASDSWTTGAPMIYPVVSSASAVINSKIFVIGGQNEFLPPSSPLNIDSNQIYDPATNTWSLGKNAPIGTWQAGAGATTGEGAPKRIYVIGGQEGFATGSNQNFAYDPAADVWTIAATMPTPRYSPTVAVVGDLVYVIGGGDAFNSLATNEQYTPFGYEIIPEFPSWAILPFLAITTLFMVLVFFRKRKQEG